jgi:ATP-dependent DNA helicase RecG
MQVIPNSLFKNYELMDEKGLLRAGALLFIDRPFFVSNSATVKIGAFTKEEHLIRHDLIEGPVILQPDRIMDLIMNKYVLGTDDIEWLTRATKYPYPMKAIREAVLNGIVHRDYSSVVETTIRVYPDSIEIWNPGHLPHGWTEEDIFNKHISKPANPKIAQAFYDIGYIEKFGRGIELMSNECKAMGLPLPEYIVDRDIIKVIFKLPEKREDTAPGKVPVDTSGLTVNESKLYDLICTGELSTLTDFSEATGLSVKAVRGAVSKLVEKGLIQRIGPDKSGKWIPAVNPR